jgi:TonB family protein
VRAALVPLLLFAMSCASPAPPPAASPEPEPVRAPAAETEKAIGTVRVTASALNVRAEASTTADVVAQVKRGDALSLLSMGDSWSKVRLADGATGWVATRFVEQGSGGKSATRPKTTKKGGCPPDSDYAFVETPTLSFSDRSAHGLVVVEATVSASGNVTSTKMVSNKTGDESLAFLAEREIKKARFSPPIRNCVARSFIFTYRRTF